MQQQQIVEDLSVHIGVPELQSKVLTRPAMPWR